MRSIILEGITFKGYHGVYPHEKREGTDFRVDVTLHLNELRGFVTDKLEDTLNYALVMSEILDIGTNNQYNLIEHLAWRIKETLLAHREVSAVEVRVHKYVKDLCGLGQWVCVCC